MVKKRKVRKRHSRRIHRRSEPRIRVLPSEAIEFRVSTEVAKATALLSNVAPEAFLASPYLASAVYYHDGLFDDFNENKPDADPADRIIAHIVRRLPSRAKQRAIASFSTTLGVACSELGASRLLPPLQYEPISNSSRNVHRYAIDLFAEEGTPVRSSTRGLVILAENGWQSGDWFSTSTVRGGNTVIVFDPDTLRFFRYAHLERSTVLPGAYVEAGDEIGAVGHTGFNASRKGHGRHLHWEINEYASGITVPVPHDDLQALLEAATARCPGYEPPTGSRTSPE